MSESINIIGFQPKYSQQVIDLILDIQNNEFKVGFSLEQQPDIINIDNFYINSGGDFLLAILEDQVIGTIGALKISEADYAIRKMFVAKDFRGKDYKVAQQLLDRLISSLQSKNAHKAYLGTIDKYQAAIRFYSKNGFTQLSKEELPSYFPLAPVDNVFFYKKLL